MDITAAARKRHSTKSFIAGKTISAEQEQALKDLLRFAASSVNSQPWHFIFASTDAGKARIAKSTQGMYNFNEKKVLNASHVVVFCSRLDMDDDYAVHITEQEDRDGRFIDEQARAGSLAGRKMFMNLHRVERKDTPEWAARQTYLNLGAFLLGVGALGLDAVPIEGFDADILDAEFGLKEKGFQSLALVAVGYHAEDDFNAKLPKSRLPELEILTEI